MSLETKLEQASNNYDISRYGIPRLFTLGALQHQLGLNLSQNELRTLGKLIREKTLKDFKKVLIPETNAILQRQFNTTSVSLPILKEFSQYRLNSEGKLMEKLIQTTPETPVCKTTEINMRDFDQNIGNIATVSNLTPINIYQFHASDLGLPENSGIEFVTLRIKDWIRKVHKMYGLLHSLVLTPEKLLGDDGKMEYGHLINEKYCPSGLLNLGIEYIREILENQNDFYESFYDTPPTNFFKAKYEQKYPKNKKADLFTSKFNSTFEAFIPVDDIGIMITMRDQQSLNEMRHSINKSQLEYLPSRYDDCLRPQKRKDGSVVYGLRDKESFLEVRLNLLEDLIESKFGSNKVRAHHEYEQNAFQTKVLEAYQSRKVVKSITRNLEAMSSLKHGGLFAPQKLSFMRYSI